MQRSTFLFATHRISYIPRQRLPQPACPRWDMRLAKARLWDEHIDNKKPGSWQIEDYRDLDPTHKTFIGSAIDDFTPLSGGGLGRPTNILNRRLPNQTVHEAYTRLQIPHNENALYGKAMAEMSFMGTQMPYGYLLYKQLQRCGRNDHKPRPDVKFMTKQGISGAPKGFVPWPDAKEEKEEGVRRSGRTAPAPARSRRAGI